MVTRLARPVAVAVACLALGCGSDTPDTQVVGSSTAPATTERPRSGESSTSTPTTMTPGDSSGGTVEGVVLADGTCPGPRRCEPPPVPGTVIATTATTGTAVEAVIGDDGRYRLMLSSGAHNLVVVTDRYPACETAPVTVKQARPPSSTSRAREPWLDPGDHTAAHQSPWLPSATTAFGRLKAATCRRIGVGTDLGRHRPTWRPGTLPFPVTGNDPS